MNLRIVQYYATRVSTGCVQDNETWAETRSGRIETWTGRVEGEGGGGRWVTHDPLKSACGIRWEHAATVHILALNDITGNKINIVSGSIVGQG